MKKFLLLIAFALVALVGCKCEDKYPLDGTVWKGVFEVAKMNATLSFYETTFKIEVEAVIEGSLKKESAEGTYVYKHPDVTLTVKGEENVATIKDNKMTMDGYTFTRQ